jgi:hypothetical protein
MDDMQMEHLARYCCWCGDDVDPQRWAIGYKYCLTCGEDVAVSVVLVEVEGREVQISTASL